MAAPLTEEQRSRIIKLRKENKTQQEIAEKLGIHAVTVSKFLKQKGLGRRSDTNPGRLKRKTELVDVTQASPPPLPELSAEAIEVAPTGSDTMVGRLNAAIRLMRSVIEELEKMPRIR